MPQYNNNSPIYSMQLPVSAMYPKTDIDNRRRPFDCIPDNDTYA